METCNQEVPIKSPPKNSKSQEIPSKYLKEPDFFLRAPLGKMKNAIAAPADPEFNPKEEVVIEVGDGGCEITVYKLEPATGKECFGHLRLKAKALATFECSAPLRGKFNCQGIVSFLQQAEDGRATVLSLSAVSDYLYVECEITNDGASYHPLKIPLASQVEMPHQMPAVQFELDFEHTMKIFGEIVDKYVDRGAKLESMAIFFNMADRRVVERPRNRGNRFLEYHREQLKEGVWEVKIGEDAEVCTEVIASLDWSYWQSFQCAARSAITIKSRLAEFQIPRLRTPLHFTRLN